MVAHHSISSPNVARILLEPFYNVKVSMASGIRVYKDNSKLLAITSITINELL